MRFIKKKVSGRCALSAFIIRQGAIVQFYEVQFVLLNLHECVDSLIVNVSAVIKLKESHMCFM